ncbi:MAG TPA: hypothetical protein VLK79_16630 [Gaiellales bacterium]|nr:hypothetical protein [Gaiellales bacterium]
MRQALRRARSHGLHGSTGPSPHEVARVLPPPSLPHVHLDPAELRRIARKNLRGNRGQPLAPGWR